MNKFLLLLTFVSASLLGYSQDTASTEGDTIPPNWTIDGGVALMINHVGLYNWQGGGEPSFSASVLYKGNFNYKKGKWTWGNSAEFAYGVIRQGTKELNKSDDRWEINTKAGHDLNKKWDLNGFATLRSQFTEGFDPDDATIKISDIMAPGYLLTGIGANFKHKDWLNINLSPSTAKFTFVMNDSLANFDVPDSDGNPTGKGKYGNDAGKNTRTEIGAYAKISIKKEVFENVTLNTQADFFTDYLNNFGAIDVTWNLAVIMQINKYLACTITTNLIYDEDIAIVLERNNAGEPLRIGPAVQFKETIGVGLTYKY